MDYDYDKQTAIGIVENWNGKDYRFAFEGEIYTEDDVNEAQEYLESINYKI